MFLIGTSVPFPSVVLTTGDYQRASYTLRSQNVIFRPFHGGCGPDDGAGRSVHCTD